MADAQLYHSTVVTAVTQSLETNKALLVVLDERSELETECSMLNWLKDEDIISMLRERSIPLRLTRDKPDFSSFSQIFPVNKIPSIYVIKQGQVLDVIFQTDISKQLFKERLEKYLTVEDPASIGTSSPSSPPALALAPPVNPTQISSATTVSTPSIPSTPSISTPIVKSQQASSSSVPLRDASAQANELTSTQKYQLEQQQKRKHEQDERKRILRQINADKEERRSRRRSEDHVLHPEQQQRKPRQLSSSHNARQCALSIRLFDGEAVKHIFSSQETLLDVRKWLDQNRTDGNQAYSFLQSIPKRHFSDVEEGDTLISLELTPSATLILKPAINVSTAYDGSGSWVRSALTYVYGGVAHMMGLDQENASESDNETAVNTPTGSKPGRNFGTLSDDDESRTTYNGNQLSLEDNNTKKTD